MLEQIKDLCLFMICGQTLLYFQSGKKYEKICRMILELLILAGIVGMLLNVLQSLGFRKGELEAAGGAVAGMQRSMEESLSRQLGTEGIAEDFLAGDALNGLIEKYTASEIKSRYNNYANQYGFEIQEVKKQDNKLQVFLKESGEKAVQNEMPEEVSEEIQNAGNPAKIVEIEQIEINEITWDKKEENESDQDNEGERLQSSGRKKEELETFRRQLALVFAMNEEELEVILID